MKRKFDLSRKSKTLTPIKKFVIYSEGLNTEPAYLSALGNSLSKVLVQLQIVGGAGDPKTLAEKANAFKKGLNKKAMHVSSYERSDEVWVVFDRDEHPKVKETIDNCRGSGIGVAYSNPCFELWLILHYEDFDRSLDRHQVQRHFGTLCASYTKNKGKKPDCEAFIGSVGDAIERAKAMKQRREQDGLELGPPFTDVHILVERLLLANKVGLKAE